MLEVCGGRGGVTRACRKRGILCGPVIELALGYDVFDASLFDWLLRLSLSFANILYAPGTTVHELLVSQEASDAGLTLTGGL